MKPHLKLFLDWGNSFARVLKLFQMWLYVK